MELEKIREAKRVAEKKIGTILTELESDAGIGVRGIELDDFNAVRVRDLEKRYEEGKLYYVDGRTGNIIRDPSNLYEVCIQMENI